jgi:signal transduction histidine kinase
MSERTWTAIGRSIALVSIGSAIAGCFWLVVIGRGDSLYRDWIIHNGVVAVGFGLVAFLVLPSQPRNAVVWVSAWSSLFGGLYCLAIAIMSQALRSRGLADYLDLAPNDLPFGLAVVAQYLAWAYVPALVAPLTLGFSLFPDGRLPGHRWRWLTRVTLIDMAVLSVALAYAYRPSSDLTFAASVDLDPVNFASAGVWVEVAISIATLALVGIVVVSLCALVIRLRGSTGAERAQFKWILWSGTVTAAFIIPGVIVPSVNASRALLLVGLAILVGAYGVAIGRYRLYEIDVVINRTVVFAILVGFITLVYAVIAVAAGAFLAWFHSGLLLPLLGTAVVAVAFEPVRAFAQRWANRLVYGRRATPYEVLSGLTERLADGESGEGILQRMADLLAAGTGAQRASVWLGSSDDMSLGGNSSAAGDRPARFDVGSEGVFLVHHDGEVVGALEVVKPRGVSLSSTERSLVDDLAGSAGAVLGYQRLIESLAETAHQVEASRSRLVGAQDAERQRLERELHDGAQQQILALKVKIGLAGRAARAQQAEQLSEMLDSLADEAQKALEEVRALAKGIYPPVLISDGLVAAVSSLAASSPVEISVDRDGVGRYEPEVETAVYFNISEALTNAVKHGRPPISVRLRDRDGALEFSVSDGGPGFDVSAGPAGSGLANMADRLDAIGGRLKVESSPGSGTVVEGSVPIPALV